MITIISGGQSGVDIGAWRAARAAGLPTGGWMPRAFLAEDGPHEDYAQAYGAAQLPDSWASHSMAQQYRERTRLNVEMATHVLLITADPDSPGSRLTWRLAVELERERFGVPASGCAALDPDEFRAGYHGKVIREFARDCMEKGGGLMVAGTRQSKAPGIDDWVERILTPTFRELARTLDHAAEADAR